MMSSSGTKNGEDEGGRSTPHFQRRDDGEDEGDPPVLLPGRVLVCVIGVVVPGVFVRHELSAT
jgi:hypothetical protein